MTIYYVDSVATGIGDGLSEVNAFTTIDAAMNIMATAGVAPHTVYVKASGTYDENGNIDTAETTGTATITFEGYSSTPGDNGKVTWTNSSGSALTGSVNNYCGYIFKNFKFNNCSSYGVSLGSNDFITFYNCEFSNNGNSGIDADTGGPVNLVNCVGTGNTGAGCNLQFSGVVLGCIFHTNTTNQIFADGSPLIYKNVCYGHTASGSDIISVKECRVALANTVDGENITTTGINMDPGSGFDTNFALDNIVYDCGTGIDISTSYPASSVIGYNLVNSNATADYPITTGEIGYQDVTSAPAFTDEANDDYTLGGLSPAIGKSITPGGIT